jgi:polyhydroxyalkanoate synthesis regulator phasin
MDTEVARAMSKRELHAACENYEALAAKLDADENSEHISELERAVHVMEAELERRRVKVAWEAVP